MNEEEFYKYKALKYKMIAEILKKDTKNLEKSIDKSKDLCYN